MQRNVVPRVKSKKPNLLEVAVAQINDKFSTYPSNGLTPVRLAEIFREADEGDVLRQMELFEEMEEKDPHLFSQLQTRKNAVTGLDFEIIPFSDDESDKQIAEFVKSEIDSIENFEDILMDLLDAIGKGVAFSEILWKYDEGKVTIDEIKGRHQKNFFWDHEDKLKIRTKEYPAGLELPENKFIYHRYKAKSGHPSRAGVLRIVAWMYLFKNYDIKDWVSFCEVFGLPLRLGKYNPGASEADKDDLMRALVQIGSDAAGIIPEGADIEFKDVGKTGSTDLYEKLARYCDEQMSKAVLGQTLTSDSGGGSYAQSKTHNDVRHDLTIADCKAVAATLRRDLIRPLVLFNFAEEKRIPTIRFDFEEAEDQQKMAEIYGKLIDMGLPIATSHIYEKFSIPKPEAGDELVNASHSTQSAFKWSVNKAESKTDPLRVESQKYQNQIEDLIELVKDLNEGVFAKLVEPVLGLVDQNDLGEIKSKFESESFIVELMNKMKAEDFEQLLYRAMFIADLTGRIKENERAV